MSLKRYSIQRGFFKVKMIRDVTMKNDSQSEAESRKRLMALMTRHQRQVFSYIYALVPNRYDAEDLLQETSLVICEKFDEFEEGTDFVAWACQIAYWRGGGFGREEARGEGVFVQKNSAVVGKKPGARSGAARRRHKAVGAPPP